MHHEKFVILKEIILILLVSLPIIILFRRLKISSIVGFLIAGIIIGPFGFGWISRLEDIEVMAEVGVILLLFTIGLEFSIEKLMKMKKLLLAAGGSQMLLTTIVAGAIFLTFGIPIQNAIFYGVLISFSSTAIVLKIISDRNELSSPHGNLSLSILLFQDIAIVPVMILLPLLAAGENMNFLAVGGQVVLALLLVAGIIFLARVVMPRILFFMANTRASEVFTIGLVLLVLGTAYLTEIAGLTFSIGAFIAGVIISESEFSHQTIAEILPFKDIFNSLFFVSIGMLMNLGFLLTNPAPVIIAFLGILIVKTLIIMLIVKALKYPLRTGMLTGAALAQIGEFSFLVAQAGMGLDLIPADFFNIYLAASIFTMIVTPFLIDLTPKVFDRRSTAKAEPSQLKEEKGLSNHVIVVGYGLNGKNLTSVLRETGIPYIIVELNPVTVRRCLDAGDSVLYGDITKKEILHVAGIERASVIVFAISDPYASETGVKLAKQMNKDVFALVRTRYIAEVDHLIALGADEVIPEEFETSLQLFQKVLTKYHIPYNIVMKQVALLRGESYKMLRKEGDLQHKMGHLNEILAAGLTEIFYVDEENAFIGKTLKESDLRARTGATVIAIVRKETTVSNPTAEETIRENDMIVITGDHFAVDKAVRLLDSKPGDEENSGNNSEHEPPAESGQ